MMLSSGDIQQQIAKLEEKAYQLKEQVWFLTFYLSAEKIPGSS